jgi:hypothetical protein
MPDDMLKDAIETARRVIQAEPDFETQGMSWHITVALYFYLLLSFAGLQCAETIKNEFDSRWSPHWHCVIGRNFGSFVTHETKNFIFFYLGDKAVMLFKSG